MCTLINVLAMQRLAVLESVTNVAMEPAFLRKMQNVMDYLTATIAVMRKTVVSFILVMSRNSVSLIKLVCLTYKKTKQICHS